MTTPQLRQLRSRQRTYMVLIGTIASALCAGVLVPIVFGEPVTARRVDVGAGAGLDGAPADAFGESGELLSEGGGDTGEGSGSPDALGGASSAQGGAGAEGGPGSSASGGGAGQAASTPAGSPAGATDTGVTATTVRIAVFESNAANLAKAGFAVDAGDRLGAWTAYFKELNDAGGVHGRKVEFKIFEFDPLDRNDARRACVEGTEDYKAFAAVSTAGLFGPAVTCVTEQHGLPYIATRQNFTDEQFDRSKGLLFGVQMSLNRNFFNHLRELDRLGLLDKRVVGIVDNDQDVTATRTYIEGLRGRGYSECRTPATAPCYIRHTLAALDPTLMGQQSAVAVDEMQRAGANPVIMHHNLAGMAIYIQQAEKRQYFPQYSVGQLGTYVGANNPEVLPPQAFDGAIGVAPDRVGEVKNGIPQPAPEVECEKRFERAGGKDISYAAYNGDYQAAMLACAGFDALVYGLQQAGPRLTRARLAAALANRGEFNPPLIFPGKWAPGRGDGSDFVRTLVWRNLVDGRECRCWRVVEQPKRAASNRV